MTGTLRPGLGYGRAARFMYIATAGQTTFSGADNSTEALTLSYTPNFVEVAVNGLWLPPTDYTATNGSSIVFASGLTAGDIVYVYVLSVLAIADAVAYTGAQAFSDTQQAQARANIGITGGLGIYNLSIAVSASASALTIALKTAAGNDPSPTSPVVVDFRNSTLTSSVPTSLAVTAATSLVISSGSTLGVVSATAFRLWVVGFNDGGVFRLGVIRCFTTASYRIYPLVEAALASSTAEGGAGAADSAGVFYTGTAVTSKAFRILGYIEWGASGLTAGTWTTTNLLAVQLFGSGVKLPGDLIQRQVNTTSQAPSCTSTTFVDSTHTVSFTLTSAANLIEADVDTYTYFRGAGTQQAFIKLLRDAIDIGFVTIQQFEQLASESITMSRVRGADFPNSTAALTYKLSYANSTTEMIQYFFNGLTVQETMT